MLNRTNGNTLDEEKKTYESQSLSGGNKQGPQFTPNIRKIEAHTQTRDRTGVSYSPSEELHTLGLVG